MISKFLRNCSSLVLLFPLLQLLRLDMLNAAPLVRSLTPAPRWSRAASLDSSFVLSISSTPCSWTCRIRPKALHHLHQGHETNQRLHSPTARTFQFDSFLETTRTFLGMESFDEVVKLCDASTHVAFLEAGKTIPADPERAAQNGCWIQEWRWGI